MLISKIGFLLVFSTIILCSNAKKAAHYDECEVCTDVLEDVVKLAQKDNEKLTPDNVRSALLKYCKKIGGGDQKNIVGDDAKRAKICFYIGASDTSATSIINEVTKPLAFFKPPEKVCASLKSKDSQICELKFDKPIDWATIDLSGMRVKQLKELLAKLKGDCKGCTEKSDYITRIKELKPKEEL